MSREEGRAMENRGAEAVVEGEKEKIELSNEKKILKKKKLKKKKKKRYSWIPRFPCTRLDDDEASDVGGFDVSSVEDDESAKHHLIVMVNGIVGRFAFDSSRSFTSLMNFLMLVLRVLQLLFCFDSPLFGQLHLKCLMNVRNHFWKIWDEGIYA